MRRLSCSRCLTAATLCAALATGRPGAFAQTPPAAADPATLPPAAVPSVSSSTTPASIPPAPEDLGDSLLAQKRYQAAIEAYKQVPVSSADTWNKMGIAYQMMFNLEEASRCYERSLKLNPRNARVLNNLASVYDAQKDLSAAEHYYRKALRLEPKAPMILRNLGTNLLAQHKYKKGWALYQAALALDPNVFGESASPRVDNPASVQERGAMNYYMAKGCVRAGQNDRAIEYLRMALNEGYTNPKKIQADSEFAVLRGNPAYEQLLASQSTPKQSGKL
ncbi:MAG: tetratricopeptide repeat protein [Terracidiphilus sp.]|jgi:Tfp pilus assembly protein PilF